MNFKEIELTFDPTYGLEILLFTSLTVFAIVLIGLVMLLYAPKLRQLAFRYRPMRGSLTSNEGLSSRGSRTSSTSDSDLESYYIPGQYADKLKFKKQRNPRLLGANVNGNFRQSRDDFVINSTYKDDAETVSFNRYFPGLKELSRISALSPDDLMVKLQNDYETYSKVREKIQARKVQQCTARTGHDKQQTLLRPYIQSYPEFEHKVQYSTKDVPTKKLKSILKKSISDSSTLNPSFSRPKSEHLSYVV